MLPIHFRHTPLLVWTVTLTALTGLLIVGLQVGLVVDPPTAPARVSFGDAVELRARAASLQSAVNADDPDRIRAWADHTAAVLDTAGTTHPDLSSLAEKVDTLADAADDQTTDAADAVLADLADLTPSGDAR